MENYEYKSILADEHAFRLILLYPGWQPKIEIEIIHASFDEQMIMSYEAVSYAWGQTDLCASVFVQNPQNFGPKTEPGPQRESVFETCLKVPNSLELVLRDLRHTDAKRCLWIDAICINQNDQNDQQLREKSHQVKLMDKVYNRAERVLFHLGRPTDMTAILKDTLTHLQEHQDTQRTIKRHRPQALKPEHQGPQILSEKERLQGLEQELEQKLQNLEELEKLPQTIEVQEQVWQKSRELQELQEEISKIDKPKEPSEIQNPRQPEKLGKCEISEADWEQVSGKLSDGYINFHDQIRHSMEHVLAQPWFRRVWIIQEVANSRGALIYWGPVSLSVRWFVDLARRLDVNMDTHQKAILDMMPRSRRDKLNSSSGQDLYELLVRFNRAQASRDHDRIFALLGMCQDGKRPVTITIDYSQSLDCLLRDTIAKIAGCDESEVPTRMTEMKHFKTGIRTLLEDLVVEFAVASKITSLESLLMHRGDQIIITPPMIDRMIEGRVWHEAFRIVINHRPDTIVVPVETLEHAYSRGRSEVTELLLTRCTPFTIAERTLAKISTNNVRNLGAEKIVRLGRAILVDDLDAVRQLLEEGVDLQARGPSKLTPLSLAGVAGKQDSINILLNCGADIEARDSDGRTALVLAVVYGQKMTLEILLDHGANLETRDSKGRTALSLAIRHRRTKEFKVLLDHGANLESADKDGCTALSLAVKHGRTVEAKVLLDHGGNLETRDSNGRTPLSLAASGGYDYILSLGRSPYGAVIVRNQIMERYKDSAHKPHISRTPKDPGNTEVYTALLRLLLDRGAKINSADNASQTPLWWAVNRGHESAVQKLLAKKADTEQSPSGQMSLLSWAIWNGYKPIASQLLAKVAPRAFPTHDCLEWAIRCQKKSLIKELLAKCAAYAPWNVDNVSSSEKMIDTSLEDYAAWESGDETLQEDPFDTSQMLHADLDIVISLFSVALENYHSGVLEVLVQYNLFPKSTFVRSITLVHAVSKGDRNLVKVLLEAGCDANCEDSKANTLLSRAVEQEDPDMVKVLLAGKSNPDGSSRNHCNPLARAAQLGCTSIVKDLIESRANVDARCLEAPDSWLRKTCGKLELLQFPSNSRAMIDIRDTEGRTPLMWACRNGLVTIVKLLLDAHADVDVRDGRGETALDWAKCWGKGNREQIVQMLQDGLMSSQ